MRKFRRCLSSEEIPIFWNLVRISVCIFKSILDQLVAIHSNDSNILISRKNAWSFSQMYTPLEGIFDHLPEISSTAFCLNMTLLIPENDETKTSAFFFWKKPNCFVLKQLYHFLFWFLSIMFNDMSKTILSRLRSPRWHKNPLDWMKNGGVWWIFRVVTKREVSKPGVGAWRS